LETLALYAPGRTVNSLRSGKGNSTLLAAPRIGGAQPAYRAEYKLSVVGNRPIPFAEGAFQWAELVTARSNGRINVKVYPGSQLVGGDQTRELVAMRQGVIDILVSSTINISPQIPQMNLFSLPFLMPNPKAFDALIQGETRAALDATLAQREARITELEAAAAKTTNLYETLKKSLSLAPARIVPPIPAGEAPENTALAAQVDAYAKFVLAFPG
jgi:TRAP-type C4-dicarboxylate transport system substrate-binding protein